MLVKKTKHRELQILGIDLWEAKQSHRAIGIKAHNICVHAKCLALVYQKDHSMTPQEKQILDGMLSVLNLAPSQIMRATIYLPEINHNEIWQKIVQWQPKYILQLNTEVPGFNSPNCIQTYSPEYLRLNPQYKPQAYKSLLNLRAMLHGTS